MAVHSNLLSFTYLGHIITSDRKDDEDIMKQIRKLNVIGNTLIRKFSFCTTAVKLELFRSYCYSLYCNALWARYKVTTLNKLRVCHNDILKRLLGVPRYVSSSQTFVTNNVNNVDVLRRIAMNSLMMRMMASNNALIISIRQSSAFLRSPMCVEWQTKLYVHQRGNS